MSRGITEADLMTDQALLEVIFSPLFSIRTEADELAGRGIGLAVVRQEARALGGDATVVSTPGKGTKFTITFQKQALFTQG
jgi:chemotaxis protein histidine kinase CheA